MKQVLWDNRCIDWYKDFYIPVSLRHHRLNPEEMRMLRELPENKRCEECRKTVWVCACNIYASDYD